jgi:methionine-rich copper-binding protein CopC
VSSRALVATAAVLLIPAATAWAHTPVKSVSPGKSKTVHRSVREVRVTFEAAVSTGLIEIKTSSGRIVGLRANGLKSSNKAILRAVPRTPLGSGRYTVSWRARASDGHSEKGSWSFRVDL